MKRLHDEFLSEEDMDLRNMSEEELNAYWDLWLEQAQVTNDTDRYAYSHGVFVKEPTLSEHLPRVAEDRESYGPAV